MIRRLAITTPAITLVLVAAFQAQAGGEDPGATWPPLIRAGNYAGAQTLCEGYLTSEDAHTKAEGHKCLANVVLAQQRTPAGSADARKAVEHLDAALALAPQDLSVHQARLHILMAAQQWAEMEHTLEESIAVYRGPDPVSAWINYPAELFELRKFDRAVSLLRILERHYPEDHRIPGNLSAALAMLKQDDEALQAAQRAVKLAPGDPRDNWNLARIYDYTGKLDLADHAYQKALSLESNDERRAKGMCVYADFVATKLKDQERAREWQHKGRCAGKEQAADGCAVQREANRRVLEKRAGTCKGDEDCARIGLYEAGSCNGWVARPVAVDLATELRAAADKACNESFTVTPQCPRERAVCTNGRCSGRPIQPGGPAAESFAGREMVPMQKLPGAQCLPAAMQRSTEDMKDARGKATIEFPIPSDGEPPRFFEVVGDHSPDVAYVTARALAMCRWTPKWAEGALHELWTRVTVELKE